MQYHEMLHCYRVNTPHYTCACMTPQLAGGHPLILKKKDWESGEARAGNARHWTDAMLMIRRWVTQHLFVCLCTEMKKSLGWFQLICLGIGAIIGAGIFVITGTCQLMQSSMSFMHSSKANPFQESSMQWCKSRVSSFARGHSLSQAASLSFAVMPFADFTSS